jgi:RHS repeat-associated protein
VFEGGLGQSAVAGGADAGDVGGLAHGALDTGTFDGLDRATSATYPAAGGLAGETVSTGYSGAYATSLSSATTSYVASTAYTGIGQPTSQILGTAGGSGSVQRTSSWDTASGRLLNLSAVTPSSGSTANVQNDSYTYSPTGDITKNTDGVAGQQQCYSYDTQDRLVAAATSASSTAAGTTCTADASAPTPYSEVYAYDADANLTSLTHNGTGKTFGYGTNTGLSLTGGPHAPTTTATGGASTTYSYDPDGQLTTKVAAGVTTRYTWDPQGHLTSANVGGATSSFTYGPDGSRWVQTNPTETVVYLAGQELHQATGATTPTVQRTYTLAGTTIAVRKTGTTAGLYWLLTDQQGSASIGVNTADGTVTRDRYLPFGGDRATTSTGSPLWTLPTDRGWIGQVQDTSTSLDYLNARYYDPTLAHFISTDPLNITASPATTNPYTYGDDNPITFSDPTGQDTGSWCSTSACTTYDDALHAGQTAAAAAAAVKAEEARIALAAARAAAARAAALAAARVQAALEAARERRVAAQAAAAKAAIAAQPKALTGHAAAYANATRNGGWGSVPTPVKALLGVSAVAVVVAACVAVCAEVAAGAAVWAGAGAGAAAVSAAGSTLLGLSGADPISIESAAGTAGGAGTVFRADTRGPEEIFSQGFQPKGKNLDLVQHVTQNPADSGFVSTTHHLGSAQDFADEVGAPWIYKARASGIDVNAHLGSASPFPWENEIAVPGPVSASSIEGAWGPGGWASNPGWKP